MKRLLGLWISYEHQNNPKKFKKKNKRKALTWVFGHSLFEWANCFLFFLSMEHG
jgi:hypothetical protein